MKFTQQTRYSNLETWTTSHRIVCISENMQFVSKSDQDALELRNVWNKSDYISRSQCTTYCYPTGARNLYFYILYIKLKPHNNQQRISLLSLPVAHTTQSDCNSVSPCTSSPIDRFSCNFYSGTDNRLFMESIKELPHLSFSNPQPTFSTLKHDDNVPPVSNKSDLPVIETRVIVN